jgi:hypothetical protein
MTTTSNFSVLRVARPTDNLPAITSQYIDGLGFTLLSSFSEHDGFSGSIVGHPNAPYHLEFTTFAGGKPVGRAPTEDNLLVFYIPDGNEWEMRAGKMETAGWIEVKSFNPWWDREGVTFEDVDGYRVVLQKGAWNI